MRMTRQTFIILVLLLLLGIYHKPVVAFLSDQASKYGLVKTDSVEQGIVETMELKANVTSRVLPTIYVNGKSFVVPKSTYDTLHQGDTVKVTYMGEEVKLVEVISTQVQ